MSNPNSGVGSTAWRALAVGLLACCACGQAALAQSNPQGFVAFKTPQNKLTSYETDYPAYQFNEFQPYNPSSTSMGNAYGSATGGTGVGEGGYGENGGSGSGTGGSSALAVNFYESGDQNAFQIDADEALRDIDASLQPANSNGTDFTQPYFSAKSMGLAVSSPGDGSVDDTINELNADLGETGQSGYPTALYMANDGITDAFDASVQDVGVADVAVEDGDADNMQNYQEQNSDLNFSTSVGYGHGTSMQLPFGRPARSTPGVASTLITVNMPPANFASAFNGVFIAVLYSLTGYYLYGRVRGFIASV